MLLPLFYSAQHPYSLHTGTLLQYTAILQYIPTAYTLLLHNWDFTTSLQPTHWHWHTIPAAFVLLGHTILYFTYWYCTICIQPTYRYFTICIQPTYYYCPLLSSYDIKQLTFHILILASLLLRPLALKKKKQFSRSLISTKYSNVN